MSKEATLLCLAARSFQGGAAIVFCGTKQQTHRMHLLFRLCGLPSTAELHGNLTQAQRLASLEAFRKVRGGGGAVGGTRSLWRCVCGGEMEWSWRA